MAKKLKLEIPMLLPDIPDVRDGCTERLVGSLWEKDGVEHVHIIEKEAEEPAQLCIHYNPEIVSLPRIRQIAEREGAALTDEIGHVVWEVKGLRHARRARTVGERLRRLDGVLEAEAAASGQIRLEFEREVIIEEVLKKELRGLDVTLLKNTQKKGDEEGHHMHEGGVFGEKTELVFAILAGIAVGLGWLLDSFTGVAAWIPLGLFIGAYCFGGFFTIREAWDSIRVGRFEIDFLMLVAAAGAAMLGEWFEGALLLFLFSMGHALEHYAMGRAKKGHRSAG